MGLDSGLIKLSQSRSKNLVFVSAGDRAQFHQSDNFKKDKNFDLWITYYDDKEKNQYIEHADFYNRRKGSKFINFHYIYQRYRNLLQGYEAIFLIDDDLGLKVSNISRLFEIRQFYDLWILQPSFDPRGKISHAVTRSRPFSSLRYTNFIEVTCPLFKKDKLDLFMKEYNPIVEGAGLDYWYSYLIGNNHKNKLAIIDSISCINPNSKRLGIPREIDKFQDSKIREMNWRFVQEQLSLPGKKSPKIVYSSIRIKPNMADACHSLKMMILFPLTEIDRFFYKLIKKIKMIIRVFLAKSKIDIFFNSYRIDK
ncbi:MAG: hypothetical protein PHV17_01815 [Candidatus Omnitrophica bacterium]|nr:hypothetical protein [Candidatus Omnitrophota bacterium]